MDALKKKIENGEIFTHDELYELLKLHLDDISKTPPEKISRVQMAQVEVKGDYTRYVNIKYLINSKYEVILLQNQTKKYLTNKEFEAELAKGEICAWCKEDIFKNVNLLLKAFVENNQMIVDGLRHCLKEYALADKKVSKGCNNRLKNQHMKCYLTIIKSRATGIFFKGV